MGEVLESGGFDFLDLVKVLEVVLDGHSSLYDVWIFKDFGQGAELHDGIKPEEKGLVGGRELKQGRRIVGPAPEVRLAFDVESEDALFPKLGCVALEGF